VPIVLNSGILSHLEPSGPVQACNGIALPLPLPLSDTWYPLLSSNAVITFMTCLSVSCNCPTEVQSVCHISDIWSKKTGCKHNQSCDVWGSDSSSCRSWNSSGMLYCAIGWVVPGVLKAYYWSHDPEDEGTAVLQTAGNYSPNNTVSHPRRMESSAPVLWNLQSCRTLCNLVEMC